MSEKKPLDMESIQEVGNADEILRQFDKGSDYRELKGFAAKIISAILICFTLFQLYTGVFGVLDAMLQRAIHLAFGLSLVYLLYPTRKNWSREKMHPVDVLLAVTAASVCMYIVVFYKELVFRAGRVTTIDMIVGLIAIILVLEAARRVIGWPMVVIAVLFIGYALIGPYIPGKLAHRGVDIENLVQQLFFTTEGILGIPIGVSSTFIFMFLLFGAYLEKTGMGEFFIDSANAIAGFAAGGPAKVAVISSGCMGTLTGSSVANVVGTGSFTIPMMKKLGYKSEFAGAVEATASTGGQLMPPIMGAAAFLMAEFTNTPYVRVITAACIPALLYYFGVFAGVHFEAKKLGLKGLPKDKIPKFAKIMKERGHLLLPIILVIYLLVAGYTPIRAALGAIASSIICSALKKETRLSFRDIIDGLEKGARTALTVVSACACAGIIIGVVTQTGLGLKMGSMLVSIANGKLLLTLFFTMVTSLILGIGVPTTANYVITSTIAAPALLMLNVPILAAHMFAFYFGIIADVTPPVCLAAVAAAGVAKSEPMRTGMQAARLAIAAFLIPYIFVYSPQMLLIDVTIMQVVFIVVTSLIGIVGVAAALTGYFRTNMSVLERLLFCIGGVFLVMPNIKWTAIGGVLMIAGYFIQVSKMKKDVIA
ncbi:TRAP transporter permease [Marinisporobacter balticus]|uniref:TRAP transporter 4TM/12TM fusion protein n=1 Tax=Marinisporobacter balticus TaxID=2018667 RepID=A0A4R2KBI2_9FIRM|nr:TRAP transporter permease [Marinisporobacter balticus]TCO70174.1 TRAP transporter 4TM/12TM fusion protein [Marinisporobacter balticus]